ncbi:MAG: hypothetical protein ACLQPV_07180 [Vulcanimicrobiaceae bacterium]
MIGLVLSALVAQAGPAAKFPSAGTYNYVATVAGKQTGQMTISVAADPASGLVVSENASGNFSGSQGSGKSTMTLGSDLSVTAYSALYSSGSRNLQSNVAFKGSTANVTGAAGTTTTMNLAADANHFIVLDVPLISGFFAAPAQLAAWQDKPVIAIAPAFGQSLPLTVGSTTAPATRPATVPATDAFISLNGPVSVNLWYDPASMLVDEIDVPSQNATVSRKK